MEVIFEAENRMEGLDVGLAGLAIGRTNAYIRMVRSDMWLCWRYARASRLSDLPEVPGFPQSQYLPPSL